MTGEYFGKLYVQDKRKFNIIYKLFIDKSSYLLKQIGVNINTLPVLDLRIKGASNIIGDRSFSENKKIVSKVGDICIDLFNQNSIATVIKHIPGHGLAKVDSHNFTPVVDKTINYLIKNDFFPFKNKDSLFAMTAHIIYKKIDPLNTATHSKKIIANLMSQEKTVEKKLSRAAVETLAIIVYHQPVTRAEIEEIRGVAFGTNTLDILMELNWVKPGGRKDVPGRPIQYVTTDDFLSHFNIQKLSDLPNIDELGAAGMIDSSSVDSAIFGTGKFYKEKQEEKKEDIYSNIDEMLSSTLDSEEKE